MKCEADKISIIIPAYNAEPFIERAITSVLKQSYKNVQLVIVNDGSLDNTNQIVKRLCDRYSNIYLIETENHGVSHARNVGLIHADGEYITFLDADDILADGALEDMLQCMKKNGLDIVSCKLENIGQQHTAQERDSGILQVYVGKEALLRSIEDYPETYSACAKLYRHSKIENVRFPEGKRVHEDSFFVFQCLTKNVSFGVYDKTNYFVYCTEESASRAVFSDKFFDILDLAERKCVIIAEEFPEYVEQSKLLLLKANMALLNCLCKTKEKKYRASEKACVAFVLKNQKYFKAAIRSDAILLWSIRLRMFWLYKLLYRVKNRCL